jgi:hypothetical protein
MPNSSNSFSDWESIILVMPGIFRLITLYRAGGLKDKKHIIGNFHLPPIMFKARRKGQSAKSPLLLSRLLPPILIRLAVRRHFGKTSIIYHTLSLNTAYLRNIFFII